MALTRINCLLMLNNPIFIIALMLSHCKVGGKIDKYIIIDK